MSQEQQRPQQSYHTQRHVNPNTSPGTCTQRRTGNAAANALVSSLKLPAVGQAMHSGSYPSLATDHTVAAFSSSSSTQQLVPVVAPARSSSLPNTTPMGHGQSKPTRPPPSSVAASSTSTASSSLVAVPPTPTKGINASGSKLKRVFVPRRKKSGDLYSLDPKWNESSPAETSTPSNASLLPIPPATTSSFVEPLTTVSQTLTHSTPSSPPSIQVLDKPAVASPSNTSPLPSHHPPASPIERPEPPLKEIPSFLSNPAGATTKTTTLSASMPSNRNSVIALSPGITSAVNYIMMEWHHQNSPEQVPNASSVLIAAGSSSSPVGSSSVTVATDVVSAGTASSIKEKQIEPLKRHSADKRELKESWRKSDSTNSHHTVRANASRTSRPVSWAESFHSAFTIVPPVVTVGVPPGSTNKRLSALITDADFGMPEEEFEDIDIDRDVDLAGTLGSQNFISDAVASALDVAGVGSAPENPPPVPNKSSTDSLKRSKRRSISLSSVLPSTAVNFLVGGGSSKPINAKPQLPLSSGVNSSYADARKTYSVSGPESFSANASHSQSHAHIRQQSENILIQQNKRPITTVRPVGLSFNNPQVPPMSFSPSQSSAHSQASLQQANSAWLPPSSTTANLKGKLNAFLPSLPRSEQKLPPIPPDTPLTQSPMSQVVSPPFATSTSLHARQPTLSGLGPSAAGLAKRTVERMGKRWGDMMNGLSSSSHSVHSSGLSSGSGYSSSTSTSTSMATTVSSRASVLSSPWVNAAPPIVGIGPGSAISPQGSGGFGHGLSRTSSRSSNPASGAQQGQGHVHQHSVMHTFLLGPSKSGGHKRTPNARSFGGTDMASSGASISTLASGSAASTTDSDPFSPSEPVLGRLLRGPLRKGKVVFGKELKIVVRETRIVVGNVGGSKSPSDLMEKESLVKALEKRMLPALIVRCAQHLLIWGVQEEGLFRIPGRTRHISQLRAEFDAGVDYDMTECSPGDLDPHAVASVFKAFLRELPDSILTHKLQPYFDAAIHKENTLNASEQASRWQQLPSKAGKGLPSAPKNGFSVGPLRQPPSLTTLAMPSLKVPPPSKPLVDAIRSLIVKLPPENRDLIRTVVDLINATAKESSATKMPLSNLLLVFCPSLNMSPPLLKVLCEVEGIWVGEEEEDRVIDIRKQPEEGDSIIESDDVLPPPTPAKDEVIVISRMEDSIEDLDDVDAKSIFDEEESQLSGRVSSDNPSSFDYLASAEEDSLFSEEQAAVPRRGRGVIDRSEVPTVYLDTKSHLSSSSGSSLPDPPETHRYDGSFIPHPYSREEGSSSSLPFSLNNNLPNSPSPPPLSSSAESIATPTSSANPSFLHLSLDVGEELKDLEQLQRNDIGLISGRARKTSSIVESESIEVRKRPVISNPIPITGPVQFPFPIGQTKENSVPSTPSKRRSIPFLSLSNLSTHSGGSLHNWELHTPVSSSSSSNGSPMCEEFRMKRPSLRLLFSKKSTSSLSGHLEKSMIGMPFLSNLTPQHLQERPSPRTGSDSSISTPLSAVTAPLASSDCLSAASSVNDLPPVLDTPIEDSYLKIDDFLVEGAQTHPNVANEPKLNPTTKENTAPPTKSYSETDGRLDMQGRPLRQPRLQPSSASLSLLDPAQDTAMDTKDEDWMRTVLIAANSPPKV